MCPHPDQAPIACPTDWEPSADKVSCQRKDLVASGSCSSGQFAYPNKNKCMDCPIGFECPTVNALPIPCIEGYYAETVNTNCKRCTAGYKCPTTFKDQI